MSNSNYRVFLFYLQDFILIIESLFCGWQFIMCYVSDGKKVEFLASRFTGATYMQSVSSFRGIERGCSARQANRKVEANISNCSEQQIYGNLASMGLALVSTADGFFLARIPHRFWLQFNNFLQCWRWFCANMARCLKAPLNKSPWKDNLWNEVSLSDSLKVKWKSFLTRKAKDEKLQHSLEHWLWFNCVMIVYLRLLLNELH